MQDLPLQRFKVLLVSKETMRSSLRLKPSDRCRENQALIHRTRLLCLRSLCPSGKARPERPIIMSLTERKEVTQLHQPRDKLPSIKIIQALDRRRIPSLTSSATPRKCLVTLMKRSTLSEATLRLSSQPQIPGLPTYLLGHLQLAILVTKNRVCETLALALNQTT